MESITIKDIARMCGVGVSTVSRAMNNHPDINEETRVKVMEIIEKYNYVPNNSARNLKRTESRSIIILVKGISNPFFTKMIKIMGEAIERERCMMVLRQVEENENEIDIAIELVKEKKPRGIIFLGGYLYSFTEKLNMLDVPVVFSSTSCNHIFHEKNYSFVSVDDVGESYKIVDYLCKLGHKRIAAIITNQMDVGVGRLRQEGYGKALEDNHVADAKSMIYHMKASSDMAFTMENGYEIMEEILDSGEEYTAVFAISDAIAIGACKAILERGLRIPEDISVVGFDGLDMAHFYHPSITTIRQPVEEMARETVRILFNVIRGYEEPQNKVFQGEMIIGGSTRKLE